MLRQQWQSPGARARGTRNSHFPVMPLTAQAGDGGAAAAWPWQESDGLEGTAALQSPRLIHLQVTVPRSPGGSPERQSQECPALTAQAEQGKEGPKSSQVRTNHPLVPLRQTPAPHSSEPRGAHRDPLSWPPAPHWAAVSPQSRLCLCSATSHTCPSSGWLQAGAAPLSPLLQTPNWFLWCLSQA